MRRPRLVNQAMALTTAETLKLRRFLVYEETPMGNNLSRQGLKRGPACAKRRKRMAGPRYGCWS